ncbi:MAG: DUF2244 domain-containing protein [Pseudoxanthomonas sp.]
MIEVAPLPSGGVGARLTLRPPQALSARQFVQLFCVLCGAMWLVAGLGWWTGNVFAPLFALLHSALLGASLRWLWRQGERDEMIAVSPEAVEVRWSRLPAAVFRAHPYWVRLRVDGQGEWISLSSSGRQVQVGAFLGPAERQALAGQLKDLLAAVAGRDR